MTTSKRPKTITPNWIEDENSRFGLRLFRASEGDIHLQLAIRDFGETRGGQVDYLRSVSNPTQSFDLQGSLDMALSSQGWRQHYGNSNRVEIWL